MVHMFKRKLMILFILFMCITLIGCSKVKQQTKEEIYSDFQKKINFMTSYTCTANITVINNKSQSKYIIKHTYKKPSYYKLEIIEPQNLKGKTMEYYENKIIIKNQKLGDVIELPKVGNNKLYLFIGDFIQDYSRKESVRMNFYNDDQLALEIDIPENIYFSKQILYIDKKTKNPAKMEILDNEGEKKFIVEYTDFQSKN